MPVSVAVKVQSGSGPAVQSVVELGSWETCVCSREGIGEAAAVLVGVMVGLVVGEGVMRDDPVGLGGAWVQVAGSTTLLPVGAGVWVSGGVDRSRGAQLGSQNRTKIIRICKISPN